MATLSELRDRIDEAIKKFGDREYVLTAVYGAIGDVVEITLYEDVVCIETTIVTG